jgi:hypothetical protein
VGESNMDDVWCEALTKQVHEKQNGGDDTLAEHVDNDKNIYEAVGDANIAEVWSTQNTRGLGFAPPLHVLRDLCEVLSTHEEGHLPSISTTIQALEDGSLLVPGGICAVFSASMGQYWLLWRSDKQDESERVAVMCEAAAKPVGDKQGETSPEDVGIEKDAEEEIKEIATCPKAVDESERVAVACEAMAKEVKEKHDEQRVTLAEDLHFEKDEEKEPHAKAPIPQPQLKALLANPDIKKAKFVKNVPIAVYPLDEASLSAMPSLLLAEIGALDQATYGDTETFLKANFGGVVALQVAFGKLDAYPIPPDQYVSNYKSVSLQEVLTKNISAAEGLSRILGDLNTIPGICGVLKIVPTEMVLASDIGFKVEDLLTIEAPWGGEQTKAAGTEAYLVACDAPYLINLNETGLPVAYIPVVSSSISEMLAEATSVASRPTSGKLEATNDVVELAEKIFTAQAAADKDAAEKVGRVEVEQVTMISVEKAVAAQEAEEKGAADNIDVDKVGPKDVMEVFEEGTFFSANTKPEMPETEKASEKLERHVKASWIRRDGLPHNEGEHIEVGAMSATTLDDIKCLCEKTPDCVGFAFRPATKRWYPKKKGTGFRSSLATYSQKHRGETWEWYYLEALPGGVVAGQIVVSRIKHVAQGQTLGKGDVGIVRGSSTSSDTTRVNIDFPNMTNVNLNPSQFKVEAADSPCLGLPGAPSSRQTEQSQMHASDAERGDKECSCLGF